MRLRNYRKQAGLSQAAFAAKLAEAGFPATQALISQWESGDVTIPAERCVQIEQITGCAVSRADLRPDIFGGQSATEPIPRDRSPAAAEGGPAAEATGDPIEPLSEAA